MLACFGLLVGLAVAASVWATRFLPLIDEPNHLSAVYIWHALATDPSSPLHAFYELRATPVSYFLQYFIAYASAWLVGVEAGHKLSLSLYVLGVPAAALLWCWRTGRTPWLAFAAVPIVYSHMWAYGYHAFNGGLVPCFLGIAAFDALCARPTLVRASLAAACTVACCLAHPIPLFMLYSGAAILALLYGANWRRWLLGLAAIVPSLGLLVSQLGQATSDTAGWDGTLVGQLTAYRYPWRARLGHFVTYAMDAVGGDLDTTVFYALATIAGLLWMYSMTRAWRDRHQGLRSTLLEHRSLVLGVFAMVCYFTFPQHLYKPVDIWILCGRFAPIACFFLLLSPALKPGTPPALVRPGLCSVGTFPAPSHHGKVSLVRRTHATATRAGGHVCAR